MPLACPHGIFFVWPVSELDKYSDPVALHALSGYGDKLKNTRRIVASMNGQLDRVHTRLENVRIFCLAFPPSSMCCLINWWCVGQIREIVRRNVDTRTVPVKTTLDEPSTAAAPPAEQATPPGPSHDPASADSVPAPAPTTRIPSGFVSVYDLLNW